MHLPHAAGWPVGEAMPLVSRIRPRPPRPRKVRCSSIAFGLLGDALAWRAGRSYGFRSFAASVPDAGIAVVALANATSLGPSARG